MDEDDLFDALDRAAKEDGSLHPSLDMGQIFSSWSHQAGFPLLTVQRNYENGSITISQKRYMGSKSSDLINATWWIPYNIATAKSPSFNDTTVDGWLPQHQRAKLIEPRGHSEWAPTDWVLFNKQQTGYYRVMYDIRNWKLLIAELNSGPDNNIHPISRAQLLDDNADFVRSGRLPREMLIEMVKYLRYESEYAPWVAGFKAILYLKEALESTEEYKSFHRTVVSIIRSAENVIAAKARLNETQILLETRDIVAHLAHSFDNQTYSNANAVQTIDNKMAESLFKRKYQTLN